MTFTSFLLPVVFSFLLAYFLTPFVSKVSKRLKIVDKPGERKVHKKPIPRLGGVAIFLSFLLTVFIYYFFRPQFFDFGPLSNLTWQGPFWGMVIGGIILVGAGILDDIYDLNPVVKLIFQMIAAGVAIGFGIGIDFIHLPFGGTWQLDKLIYQFNILGWSFSLVLLKDILSFFWLILVINVVNWLDGLDGLAGGVSAIAALALLFLSISTAVSQPLTALIAALLLGSVLGFLPYNFNPASIFMGDSGSQFLGYLLGVLAIICGGKLATAGLVLGFPILDGVWVILRRIFSHRSPFKADKKHLHHRLLSLGLSQKQVVLSLYLLSGAFGLAAVLTGTYRKFWLAITIIGLMVVGAIYLVRREEVVKNRETGNNEE